MRLAGSPAAASVSSSAIFSATEIEFASDVVPKTASPTPCSSSQRQCWIRRALSGCSSESKGISTGDKTPCIRSVCGGCVIANMLLANTIASGCETANSKLRPCHRPKSAVRRQQHPGLDDLPDPDAHLAERALVWRGDLVFH